MPNIRLTLEYLGSCYYGWQRQSRLPSIQGALDKCISKISNEPVKVMGAGRTDAGVHAFGQVASFKTTSQLQAKTWKKSLNSLLPDDIVVLDVQKVPASFDARRSAKGKTYEYRILNRLTPSAMQHALAWHIPYPLKVKNMQNGAKHLLGLHDFKSFGSKLKPGKNTVSKLHAISIKRRGELILFTFHGTHFLQHMIRNIVGTLVEVGQGRLQSGQINKILEGKDRGLAGFTAPPQGLFLVKVEY